jgi:voltage-gated potassium channel
MTTRQKIFQIIQPDHGESIASRIFDWTITLLILLGVIIVFTTTFDLPVPVRRTFRILGQITTLVFTVEYLLRILTADLLYPEIGPLASRIRFVFSPMALVDLVAILPFWIPMLFPSPMLGLRALRLILLLRILKLNRYFDAVRSIGQVLASKRQELIASLFFALLLMLVSSLLMYSAEHEAQPGVFRNAFSGLWWAVATLTTVGYGDIYPVTVVGRILGAFIALSGIAALAVPTGIITAGLTESLSHRAKVEEELERQRQVDDAHDDELVRQRGKDDDHDRLLREQGELLKTIAEKLERLERKVR